MTRFAAVGGLVVTALAVILAAPADGRVDARVTLSARPTTLASLQNATLLGQVDNGRADEQVLLRAKDCGQPSTRTIGLVVTREGGTWTTEFGPGVNTVLHAEWKGAKSAPVLLRQQAHVALDRLSGRRFEVGVGSKGMMWRKRVLIQRRAGGSWATVRQVVLTETHSTPGLGSGTFTNAHFRASFPRGSVLRAVLPRSEAKPCYLAGVSNTVRT